MCLIPIYNRPHVLHFCGAGPFYPPPSYELILTSTRCLSKSTHHWIDPIYFFLHFFLVLFRHLRSQNARRVTGTHRNFTLVLSNIHPCIEFESSSSPFLNFLTTITFWGLDISSNRIRLYWLEISSLNLYDLWLPPHSITQVALSVLP